MDIDIQARLAVLPALGKGNHDDIHEGACIMEAVSYIAGEPWSDHPACACPVITAFMVSWNDGLPDEERDTLLRPLIPKLLNTRGSKALEQRRSLMAADWLVRVHTVAWLRLAKLEAAADALASLPEITDMAQIPSIRGPIEAAQRDASAAWDAAGAAARAAARAAAWDAAWAAAWDAAGAAARAAARAAAWDAAGAAAGAAARAAARAAAWDAAWAAAGAAAGAAAWDALKATRAELQQSAIKLVERMCDAKDAA